MLVSAEGKGEQWYVDASKLSDKEFERFLKEITPTEVLVDQVFMEFRQVIHQIVPPWLRYFRGKIFPCRSYLKLK